jgi:hypothetical protein
LSVDDVAEISTTVTFNGVALSRLGRVTGNGRTVELWFIRLPGTTTADVVITPGVSREITAVVHNVNGADMDGVFRNLGVATGSSTAPSIAISSATNDLVLDFCVSDGNSATLFAVGASQTPVHEQEAADTDEKSASSYEAGAGSVTMSWTLAVSDAWTIAGVSIPTDGTVAAVDARLSQVAVEVPHAYSLADNAARLSQVAVEVPHAYDQSVQNLARLSQVAVEVPHAYDQSVQNLASLSQVAVEVVRLPSQAEVLYAYLSQVALEVCVLPVPPDARLSQVALEVVHDIAPSDTRATQVVIETLSQQDGEAAVTQVAIETLSKNLDTDVRASQVVIETISDGQPSDLRATSVVIEFIRKIPNHPEEGASLCLIEDDPILFASWLPDPASPRKWYAETSLDDVINYYGGWKDDRLLGVGEIRRSLSNTDWNYEVGTFSVDFADEDYAIRDVIEDGPGSFLNNREIEVFMVSPEGRNNQDVAMKIAAGFTDSDVSIDDFDQAMSVRFSCKDRVGTALGWGQDGEAGLPRRTLTSDTLPDVLANVYGKTAPYPYGDLTRDIVIPSGIFASGIDYEHPCARVLAWPVRRDVVPPSGYAGLWHEFILGGCAIVDVDAWVYDPAPNDLTFQALAGIEISMGDGTEWLVPGSTAPLYRDVVGGDSVTRRFAFMYGQGPKADAVVAGTAKLTVNMKGVETRGDGTGTLITDLFDQNLHKLENLVMVDGEGYTTGAWTSPRLFGSENIYLVDRIGHADLQTMRTDELIGGPGLPEWTGVGILGAFGERISVSDELRRQQMCADFRYGPNRHWQVTMHAINKNLTFDECAPLLDIHDIHIRSFKPYPRQSEMFNDLPYRWRRDYSEDGKWLRDNYRTTNEQSIEDHRLKREMSRLEFHYLDHDTIINYLTGVIRRRRSIIPWYARVTGSMCLRDQDYDIGRSVRLTHWRGLRPNGWVDRPLWILASTIDPPTRRVTLELLDLFLLLDTIETEFPTA